jgi:hypothetical protein
VDPEGKEEGAGLVSEGLGVDPEGRAGFGVGLGPGPELRPGLGRGAPSCAAAVPRRLAAGSAITREREAFSQANLGSLLRSSVYQCLLFRWGELVVGSGSCRE